MNDNNPKNKKQVRTANILESLKDTSGVAPSKDFMRQLFGRQVPEKKYSGELSPYGGVEIDSILSGEQEKNQKLEQQLALERNLRQEEKALVDKKTNELKLELHVLMQELSKLASVTPKLAQEVQIAAFQAPVNPGIYHLVFFEKLIEFVKSFREKIEDANLWLHNANKRAEKKNFWNLYKKHGGKRLLSAEDYSQRSAG